MCVCYIPVHPVHWREPNHVTGSIVCPVEDKLPEESGTAVVRETVKRCEDVSRVFLQGTIHKLLGVLKDTGKLDSTEELSVTENLAEEEVGIQTFV